MTLIIVISAVLVPLVFGLSVIFLFFNTRIFNSRLMLLSTAYLIGIGLITYLLFLTFLIPLSNPLLWLMITVIFTSFISIYLNKDLWLDIFSKKLSMLNFKGNVLFYFALILTFFQLCYVYIRALSMPPSSWDGFAMWSFKAKILFYNGVYAIPFSSLNHLDYPLFNSFAQLWTYLLLGEANEILGKIVFPMMYLSLLALIYSHLRKYLTSLTSIIITLLLAIIRPLSTHATLAYADLSLTVFFSAAIFFLFDFIKNRDNKSLFLSAVFMGLCAWTKNEGIAFNITTGIIFCIYLLFENGISILGKVKKYLIYIGLSLSISLPWLIFSRLQNVNVDLFTEKTMTFSHILKGLNRIPDILFQFGKAMISPSFAMIWPFFFLVHIVFLKKILKTDLKYVSLMIVLNLMIFISIYIITPLDVNWHLKTSVNRVLLQLTPIAIFMASISFSRYFNDIALDDKKD